MENNSLYYKEKIDFQIELFPESFKGYLDFEDLVKIEKNGIRLVKYPQLFIQNLWASLFFKKAVYYYGTYFSD